MGMEEEGSGWGMEAKRGKANGRDREGTRRKVKEGGGRIGEGGRVGMAFDPPQKSERALGKPVPAGV